MENTHDLSGEEYSPFLQHPIAPITDLESAIKYAIKEGMSEDERDFLVPFFAGEDAPKFTHYTYDKDEALNTFHFKYGSTHGRLLLNSGDESLGDWWHESDVPSGNLDGFEVEDAFLARRVEECWFKRT